MLMQQEEGGGARRKQPQQKKPAIPAANLDAMVADCMRDIPSDEEEGDEEGGDDPDLMAELEEMREMEEEMRSPSAGKTISFPTAIEPIGGGGGAAASDSMEMAGGDLLTTLDSRIANYSEAKSQAESSGETSRARRFGRGLATLQEQRRRVLAGKGVDDADIPPAVIVRKRQEEPEKQVQEETEAPAAPAPTPAAATLPAAVTTPAAAGAVPVPAPTPTPAPVPAPAPAPAPADDDLSRLRQRREECKAAALAARGAGDKAGALAGLAAVKECDAIIAKLQSGEIQRVEALPEIKKLEEAAAAAQVRSSFLYLIRFVIFDSFVLTFARTTLLANSTRANLCFYPNVFQVNGRTPELLQHTYL